MLHAAAHIPHQQGRPQAATARPRRAEAESFQGDDDEECVCCAAPTGTVDRTQRLQQQRLSLRMHASSALAAAVHSERQSAATRLRSFRKARCTLARRASASCRESSRRLAAWRCAHTKASRAGSMLHRQCVSVWRRYASQVCRRAGRCASSWMTSERVMAMQKSTSASSSHSSSRSVAVQRAEESTMQQRRLRRDPHCASSGKELRGKTYFFPRTFFFQACPFFSPYRYRGIRRGWRSGDLIR